MTRRGLFASLLALPGAVFAWPWVKKKSFITSYCSYNYKFVAKVLDKTPYTITQYSDYNVADGRTREALNWHFDNLKNSGLIA